MAKSLYLNDNRDFRAGAKMAIQQWISAIFRIMADIKLNRGRMVYSIERNIKIIDGPIPLMWIYISEGKARRKFIT